MNTTAAPVSADNRFQSLDVLRGIAVLGILMVNVQSFAMVSQAYQYPPAHMDIAGANLSAWFVTHVFFEMKFITIFSALFGAGVLLMVGEARDANKSLHTRRMLWLLLIGVIHAYVFWYGDILVPYAVMGLIIVHFRHMGPVKLIVWGLLWTALNGLVMVGFMASMALVPGGPVAEEIGMALPAEALASAVATYQAGFLDRLPSNAMAAAIMELAQLTLFAGRFIGVMFIGMALYKLGFLAARWSFGRYLIAGLISLGIGLPLAWYGGQEAIASGFDLSSFWVHTATNYVASLLIAFGYACVVMMVCKLPWLAIVRAPFAAAGRMAFTLYLTQTLIMVFIFVGSPGLGLFGTVERIDQVKIVLAVWVAQLIFATLWLTVFRFGPFEWLWRSLSYKSIQPIMKVRGAASPTP